MRATIELSNILFFPIYLEELDDGCTDLKIFFNKTCYAGPYLDPFKIDQMVDSTPPDRPHSAVKHLVERLHEVASDKERMFELAEGMLGTRIFSKNREKVMKKVRGGQIKKGGGV